MKLCNDTLKGIEKRGVMVPLYDRNKLKSGLVHIGFGNFHRAHYLTYLDRMLNEGKTEYGIFEIDTMPINQEYLDNLIKQDYLYTVLSLASDGTRMLRVNGPVMGYANLTTDKEKVMSVLTSPETKLVTLTITEKGYCYLDNKKSLDFDNPMIKHDLETKGEMQSAVALLSEVLRVRSESNLPLTIMSCDNVPENGRMLEKCILEFCQKKYPGLEGWISRNVAFPCTMVDRITPGTTEEDKRRVRDEYDIDDFCTVHSEDFLQWVIEDKKTTDIPDYSSVGAIVVDDVKPYELMKIRLLNGSHSALSYPSYMLGITKVHEGITNPLIHEFIRNRYMEEITTTLEEVPGINLDEYKDKLVSRFSNPYIADTILRLASDGSKKIANAILRPLEESIASGRFPRSIIFALALWEYFFIYKDENGNGMPIDDPKGEKLEKVSDSPLKFLEVAGLSSIYLENKELIKTMEDFISLLKAKGVKASIEEFLG